MPFNSFTRNIFGWRLNSSVTVVGSQVLQDSLHCCIIICGGLYTSQQGRSFIPRDTFGTPSITKLQSQPGFLIENEKITYSANSWCKIANYYINTNSKIYCCYWDLSWSTTETCHVVLPRPVMWYYWDLSCGTTVTCRVALLRPVVWHYWDLSCGTTAIDI